MIKRQYIVDYEVVSGGSVIKWGTESFELTGWFAPWAGDFANHVRSNAADFHKCESTQVRIVGVFKL